MLETFRRSVSLTVAVTDCFKLSVNWSPIHSVPLLIPKDSSKYTCTFLNLVFFESSKDQMESGNHPRHKTG